MMHKAILFFVLMLTGILGAATVGAETVKINDVDAAGRKIAWGKCTHPKKVVVNKIKNRYENVTDEIKTYFCDGFRVKAYEAHASGIQRELPMAVELYDRISVLLPFIPAQGTTSQVKQILGSPYSIGTDTLVYSLSDELERVGQDLVTFKFSHGKLSRVIWEWEVD